jgi:bifunctional UDP-N-acetylglucosamine pyrophosphorylase/glucosamine-1-phosphate N-acetyltransferase
MVCASVILAAGMGTRMKSESAKVLHDLGGYPLIQWALNAGWEATGREPVLVIGPDAEDIRAIAKNQAAFVEQPERLGTGHAVMQAKKVLQGKSDLILVTYADMPLLRIETLKRLIKAQEESEARIALLTLISDNPRGFGRIIRNNSGEVIGIVEEADATTEQLEIKEYNAGTYCFRADWLWENLPRLPKSVKGEYYLTDMVAMAVEDGGAVASVIVDDEDELIGVNTRVHLAEAHAALQRRINSQWMLAGVTIVDPANTYIGPEVALGSDTIILPNTHLEGKTIIGSACRIGPNSIIRDTSIGDRCKIESSVMEGAILEDDVDAGPFAHLRKGAHLMQGVHMGNFGEVKNSTLGPGVKMGHVSYIGDATVGDEVNIGAGTITCNYDGKQKHHTEIGARAFIGSGTMLVAPVQVGEDAITGAGSVVKHDVPDSSLVVGVPAKVIRKLEQSD